MGSIQWINPSTYNDNSKSSSSSTSRNHRRAMEKFRAAVMKIADSYPDSSNGSFMASIEQQLSRFCSECHTPDHPPYAAMIYRAIQELKERGGSKEDAISMYIRKEYDDLPWAHSTLLKHHLGKLCDCGEIFLTHKGRYSLSPVSSSRSEKLNSKRKSRWGSGKRSDRRRKKYKRKNENQKGGNQWHEDEKENLVDEIYERENRVIDILSEQQIVVSADDVEENQQERGPNDAAKEICEALTLNVGGDETWTIDLTNEVAQEERSDIIPEKSPGRSPKKFDVKQMKSQSKGRIGEVVPERSAGIEQEQLLRSPGSEKSLKEKFETVEIFSKEKEQAIETSEQKETSESGARAIMTPLMPTDCSEQHDQGEQPGELQLVTTERSSLTEREQRQLNRWKRKLSAPNPCIIGRARKVKHRIESESTQTSGQLVNPDDPQHLANIINTSVALQWVEPEQQPQVMSLERIVEPEPKTKLEEQPLIELYRPLCIKLRCRRAEAKLETAASTTELLEWQSNEEQKQPEQEPQVQGQERIFEPESEPETLPDAYSAIELQRPGRRLRRRNPEPDPEPVIAASIELSKSQPTEKLQHPKKRSRRGKAPKQKPDMDVGESTCSDQRNPQQHEQKQSLQRTVVKRSDFQMERARVVLALFSIKSLEFPQQNQHLDEDGESKHQCLGVPLKLKPNANRRKSTCLDHQNEQEQKEQKQEQCVRQRTSVRHSKRGKVDASSSITTSEHVLNEFMPTEKQQERPKSRGRSRPQKAG